MKTTLTAALLKLVIFKGFKYCYSKTTCINSPDADVLITLKPVRCFPHLKRLPKAYDTFFNLLKKPLQMAKGVDRALIVFDLDNNLLATA